MLKCTILCYSSSDCVQECKCVAYSLQIITTYNSIIVFFGTFKASIFYYQLHNMY